MQSEITMRELARRFAERADTVAATADAAVQPRLRSCVVEPLNRLAGDEPMVAGGDADRPDGDGMWRLARDVAAACLRADAPLELLEAAATLTALACDPRGPDGADAAAERLHEMDELLAGLDPMLHIATDGPYLVTGPVTIHDHLGSALAHPPITSLCRCGVSEAKPACDGACHRTGFAAAKDPKRVPDRRDEYVGQQVTVLDNRGLCQHSGLCTDRLATVFHSGSEPFVTPSGGRMDEIVRAVRDCPSGALSFALDGVEARTQVDHAGTRPPVIEVTCNGPYRLTGGIAVVDAEGRPVDRNTGASLEHAALCRCGHSQNKPFCSGMHWYVGFVDPVSDPSALPSIFEWAGGLPALTRMARLFYEKHVPADPLLGPLFAQMSADHPERVAAWLAEVFGGPKVYSADFGGSQGGYTRMISQHLGKCLSEQQRQRWIALLTTSANEAGLPNDPEFRSAFGSYLEWGTRLAVENSQTDARPPANMPVPHWDWNTAAGPPGSRVSAQAPEAAAPPPIIAPAPDEPVSFAAHIKPLFRQRDRASMLFVFDLWSYEDVQTHADAIAERLRAGTMPCDGTWPGDQIDVLTRWIAEGKRA
jgi:CDGSH-type Zn-finger protein/truncated hemoglobin YjbI